MSENNKDYQSIFEQYLNEFENLTPQSLKEKLALLLDPNIEFKDPFNHVFDRQQCIRVFEHMFENCYQPKFSVTHRFINETDNSASCSVYWEFEFKTGKNAQIETITGNSFIEINQHSLISKHIDYWDPAEQFYEDLPLIGWILRKIKQKVTAN